MRLFVAIELDETTKAYLSDRMAEIRAAGGEGRFTAPENLHLTLAFIGETARVRAAEEAVRSICARAFPLATGKLGRFRRDGGDLYWLGFEESPDLLTLQAQVAEVLTRADFLLERRSFSPHLTLARQVRLAEARAGALLASNLPSIAVPVREIALMRSDRPGGRLTYTPVCRRPLVDSEEGRP